MTSSSAYLGGGQSIVTYQVDGAGSTWSIAGTLEDYGEQLNLIVTRGATLESGDVNLGYSDMHRSVGVTGDGSLWDVRGNLNVGGSGTFASFGVGQGGVVIVHGDSSFTTQGSYYRNSQGIGVDGPGSLFRTEGSLTLQGLQGAYSTPSVLGVSNGARAEAWKGATALDVGEIELHGGTLAAPIVTLQGGALVGEGVVEGDVLNDGNVQPGVGGGALSVKGNFTQPSDGKFSIVLGGTHGGTEHSLLEVDRAATIAGALAVTLAAGYTPMLGDVYEVLRADSLAGLFESYTGLDVGGGVRLVQEYGPGSFSLRAVPEPATGPLTVFSLSLVAA